MKMAEIVLEEASNYGISIERNVKVDTWDNGRETGTLFIGTGNTTELKYITWMDLKDMGIRKRPSDGIFRGCSNVAWYITEEEADKLIALNASREAAAPALKAKMEEEEREYERLRAVVLKAIDDDIEPYR